MTRQNQFFSPLTRRTVLARLAGVGIAGVLPALASIASYAASVKPGKDAVLLVVDVQNCFLPGGTLAVSGGNEIIPVINQLGEKFANVIFTQDWHTEGHKSFASSHEGKGDNHDAAANDCEKKRHERDGGEVRLRHQVEQQTGEKHPVAEWRERLPCDGRQKISLLQHIAERNDRQCCGDRR